MPALPVNPKSWCLITLFVRNRFALDAAAERERAREREKEPVWVGIVPSLPRTSWPTSPRRAFGFGGACCEFAGPFHGGRLGFFFEPTGIEVWGRPLRD